MNIGFLKTYSHRNKPYSLEIFLPNSGFCLNDLSFEVALIMIKILYLLKYINSAEVSASFKFNL